MEQISRNRETFMDRISNKDESTKEGYYFVINNFENFCMEKYGNVKYILELKEMKNEQIFDILQSWINWNGSRSPSTIRLYFSKLRKYLYHMGIKLHQQDINEELSFKHKIDEELYGMSIDDIQTITKSMRYKHKTQFICQLSSLMRIGEIVQLRKKHLISDKQNIIVKIPASIAKFKKGRTTFFSKEASKLLRPILRVKNDDDLVFGSNDIKTRAKLNSQTILRNALERTGRNMKYETSKRYMINTHSFRAYGITKLSRFDPNFAKKMAGQKGYLDQYDRMSDDEKLELYQKLEINLLIDNSEILKAENAAKQNKIDELEKAQSMNKELTEEVKINTQEIELMKLAVDHKAIQKLSDKDMALDSKDKIIADLLARMEKLEKQQKKK